MNTSLWVEKYRPTTIKDVLGHDTITRLLKEYALKKRIPNLILHGDPGCGKTSTILALARDIYGPEYRKYVHEFNASDERGISVVRNKIHGISKQTPPTGVGFKMVVLDEADFLTNDAQAALRKIMEDYSDKTVFCLMCNYIHKITRPIQSRCMVFYFRPVPKSSVINSLQKISKLECIHIPDHVIESIASICGGDLRKGIMMLQQHSYKLNKGDDCNQVCTTKSEVMFPTLDVGGCIILDGLYEFLFVTRGNQSHDTINSSLDILYNQVYSSHSILRWFCHRIMRDNNVSDTAKQFILPIVSRTSNRILIGCNPNIQLTNMCYSIKDMMCKHTPNGKCL
jgi:DNA polymerase III delta prime subunit